jgi:hypothetical protein
MREANQNCLKMHGTIAVIATITEQMYRDTLMFSKPFIRAVHVVHADQQFQRLVYNELRNIMFIATRSLLYKDPEIYCHPQALKHLKALNANF